MSAAHASLEGAFPEHDPHQLVGFVVVLVGRARAAHEAEGGVSSEYDGGVVDGAEVGELDSLEVVIGLQIEGVAAEVGLPLGGHLVKALSGEVGLLIILVAGGLQRCFDVLLGSQEGLLGVSKGVEDVEAQAEFESSGQQHHQ